jgi:hypothetical protein
MTDLDPLLREAIARVHGPINPRPSLTDVRRRARRRTHRRMAAVGGALACTGVATAALVIRRDGLESPSAGISVDASSPQPAPSTTYLPALGVTTTSVYGAPTITITASVVWDALLSAHDDPSGVAVLADPPDQDAVQRMPTPEQFGCTIDQCRAMFTYVVWHEIAKTIGFGDVVEMQAMNPSIDFSVPPVEGDVLQTPYSPLVVPPYSTDDVTPTTISVFEGVMLIDGGAPDGALEDAYQRLAGYDRTIVPGTGKTVQQTMVMPIDGNDAMATSVEGLLGVDGFDTWDPSFVATAITGMVAVVIGPDYWDLVGHPSATIVPTSPTTTSVG